MQALSTARKVVSPNSHVPVMDHGTVALLLLALVARRLARGVKSRAWARRFRTGGFRKWLSNAWPWIRRNLPWMIPVLIIVGAISLAAIGGATILGALMAGFYAYVGLGCLALIFMFFFGGCRVPEQHLGEPPSAQPEGR